MDFQPRTRSPEGATHACGSLPAAEVLGDDPESSASLADLLRLRRGAGRRRLRRRRHDRSLRRRRLRRGLLELELERQQRRWRRVELFLVVGRLVERRFQQQLVLVLVLDERVELLDQRLLQLLDQLFVEQQQLFVEQLVLVEQLQLFVEQQQQQQQLQQLFRQPALSGRAGRHRLRPVQQDELLRADHHLRRQHQLHLLARLPRQRRRLRHLRPPVRRARRGRQRPAPVLHRAMSGELPLIAPRRPSSSR